MELQDLIKYLSDSFDNVDSDAIKADTKFQELEDFSSLTILEIMAIAKTKFGKTINGKEITSCQTIEDLFNMITSK